MNQPHGLNKNLLSEQYIATDPNNNSALKFIRKHSLPREKYTTMAMEPATQFAEPQPYTLLDHYCVAPKFDGRTKAGNQVWPDLENGGKIASINRLSATDS
jgi:hypothetical protein